MDAHSSAGGMTREAMRRALEELQGGGGGGANGHALSSRRSVTSDGSDYL